MQFNYSTWWCWRCIINNFYAVCQLLMLQRTINYLCAAYLYWMSSIDRLSTHLHRPSKLLHFRYWKAWSFNFKKQESISWYTLHLQYSQSTYFMSGITDSHKFSRSSHQLRSGGVSHTEFHRTMYGRNNCLNRICILFNKFPRCVNLFFIQDLDF